MKRTVLSLLVSVLAVQAGTIVDVDSFKYGCTQCNGGPNQPAVQPGQVVTPFFTGGATGLLQVTLAAGSYSVTNADPNGTDYWSAWNFEGYPSSGNWVWSFFAADASSDTIILDEYVAGVEGSQSAMSNLTGTTTYHGPTALSATSTAGFYDTFTLAATTTLDLFIDDFALGDNGGGVAVDFQPLGAGVPEPGTAVVTLAGLGALAVWRRGGSKKAKTR